MRYRITCAWCGAEVIRNEKAQRFCSQSCAAFAKHRGTPLRLTPPPEPIPAPPLTPRPALELRPCARCGTLFSPVNHKRPGRYCSMACRVADASDNLARHNP
jgi:endogenous inhibitor of DNA gyrase (YacG/DUF329 family)